MIKIKALNESSSSIDEDFSDSEKAPITREAREEQLQSLYFDALKLISLDKERAKEALNSLLGHLSKSTKDYCLNSVNHLKFLALKNLGFLSHDNLDYFLDALCLEDKDVTLWIETGKRAFKNFYNLPLARYCFEMAYKLSSENWVVLDTLISIHFILNDYENCLSFCLKSLQKDHGYTKAQILIIEMLKKFPSLHKKLPDDLMWLVHWRPPSATQEAILNSLYEIKETRKRKLKDDTEDVSKTKRKQYVLNLDHQSMSLLCLGLQIKKVYEQIEKDNLSLATVVKITFEADLDDLLSSEKSDNNNQDEPEKPKIVNRQPFPFEFMDKRRSTRVQRIQKSSDMSQISSDEVFDRVCKMIPESILSREYQFKQSELSDPQKSKEQSNDNSIVSHFLHLQNSHKHHGRRISQIIDDYLFTISSNCTEIRVPSFFIDFYRIHRCMNELPPPLGIQIGQTISRMELELILCALECEYNSKEAEFLTNILPYLESSVEKVQFDDFFLRLLIVIGSKKPDKDVLQEAYDYMVKNNIQSLRASSKTIYGPSSLQTMIKSLGEDNLNTLLSQQKHEELIEILISKSDLSGPEQKILSKALQESQDLQKSVDIITRNKNPSDELLRTLHHCLKKNPELILYNSLVMRLLELGTKKFNIEAWVCLLTILINQVDKTVKEKQLVELITILHQYLGKKGLCTGSNGRFLITALEYLTQCFESNDDLIMQCFSCLFDHPRRKSFPSPLQPHCNANQVPLTWENVELIYNYFAPEGLPEFDSLKRDSINSETEEFFRRIYPLIPEHLHPRKDADAIDQYLTSGKEIDHEFTTRIHPVTQNLYYYLADFNFKNKEFLKARDFYALDLALNPKRFDSWAACALSISHLIDQILIRSDESNATADKIVQLSESAFRCYSEALKIKPENSKIWIEHGNLAYNVGSYISRLRKTIFWLEDEENLKREKELRAILKRMLVRARNSFESANRTDHEEERWLHYYFLGKIAEKMGLLRALRYYELADLYLAMNGATYPRRIAYHNPSKLSIEALEIHYRIHAWTMKYLRCNPNISRKTLNKIRVHLLRALRSPFGKGIQRSSPTMLDHDYLLVQESSSSHKRAKVTEDIREVVDDLVSLVEDEVNTEDDRRIRAFILEMCLEAMHRCLQRFPNHYKSLYRLAHHFYSMREFEAARIVLLGRFTAGSSGSKSELKKTNAGSTESIATESEAGPVQGLFAEHKNNNLFNGIWRIPIDDIDRPGSFSAHMLRSTLLLIKISSALGDLHRLSAIAWQLSRTPDAGKRYLRDADRLRLGHEAVGRCFVILRNRISEAKSHRTQVEEVYSDIKKITDKLMKCNTYHKETSSFLSECEELVRAF